MGRVYRWLDRATHDARAERAFATAAVGGTILAAAALALGIAFVATADGIGDVLWGVAVIGTAVIPAVFAVSGILGVRDARAERRLRARRTS